MFKLNAVSESNAELFYRMTEPRGYSRPSIEGELSYAEAEARFLEAAGAGDWKSITAMVWERSTAPIYTEALAEQLRLSAHLEERSLELLEPNRKSKLVNQKVAVPAAKELRKLTLAYREKHEAYALHVSKINEYRVLTARMTASAAVLREEDERQRGVFLSYELPTLGDLEVSGEYEINSPEWHAARASGIGGSDVGAIMRVDTAFGSQNFQRVLDEKLGKERPEEDPLAFARDDLTSPIGRGNAWEEFIRHHVQDRHPELKVAFCKASWHGKGELSYRHANFDGLFLDENGIPEGVLEIKTGSNPKKWGPESGGFAGVPQGYRKQILWYAANAGLSYGKVVVILSDNDYREYGFSMEDPAIKQEVAEIYEATDRFWQELDIRKEAFEGDSSKPFRKYSALSTRESLDAIADVLSGYMGNTKGEAKKMLTSAVAQAQGRGKNKRELSRTEFQALIFSVFAQHDPSKRQRPLVGIDIETTTTSARTGRIIETGIVRLENSGELEIVYNSLHGVPEEALIGVGMGAANVHHITEERIIGKPLFEEEAETILNLLLDSTMVAHNAGFEDRFLSANLPGYVEAKAEGRITILDTRKVAKYLMPRSSDNTLQSFAEDNGVPYAGAHAAGQDALMMMKALLRLQRTINQDGRFITRRASAPARVNAAKKALLIESDR